MRCIEVVKDFTECYELSTGRLLLRNDMPIFIEHPDKDHMYILCNLQSTWKVNTFLLGVMQR